MSTVADGKPKRARRSFTEEFKAGAVHSEIDGVDAEAVAAATPIDTIANDAPASPGPGAA
jgi:hypothetical protein